MSGTDSIQIYLLEEQNKAIEEQTKAIKQASRDARQPVYEPLDYKRVPTPIGDFFFMYLPACCMFAFLIYAFFIR